MGKGSGLVMSKCPQYISCLDLGYLLPTVVNLNLYIADRSSFVNLISMKMGLLDVQERLQLEVIMVAS